MVGFILWKGWCVMTNCFIIDGHCDTLTKILDRKQEQDSQEKMHVSLKGLQEGRVGIQFFAAWIGPKDYYGPSLQRGLLLIDSYYSMIEKYKEFFYPITKFSDIQIATKLGKIGTVLTIEGGEVLEGKLSNLRILYQLGVRLLTLTWNYSNEIASGVMDSASKQGLTPFGQEVVREINDLGMMIDVSHLSTKSFWDVVDISQQPIIASHSNAYAICPHPRNLEDTQIEAIASKGGVVGINFNPPFLAKHTADISHIIKHIEYIAELVGIDVIAFGSDFDGIGALPNGVKGPETFICIIDELLKLNYSEDDVKKVCHGNFLRVMEKILR